ncbi:hypothetical protein [Amycolatopsis sp. NPDC058986]|uniref:hypothetical protein n=1 Tax=unclassified Amycolatopsis TaxID=2618356 RepID=UPI00366B1586
MTSWTLGEPTFESTSQLHKYCQNGRTLIRPLSNELRISAEELRAVLKEVPGMGMVDAKVKARIVANHLRHAAEGVDAACVGLVRCYLSFERHFLNNTPARSKKHFDLKG